jgi:hypothetical protein
VWVRREKGQARGRRGVGGLKHGRRVLHAVEDGRGENHCSERNRAVVEVVGTVIVRKELGGPGPPGCRGGQKHSPKTPTAHLPCAPARSQQQYPAHLAISTRDGRARRPPALPALKQSLARVIFARAFVDPPSSARIRHGPRRPPGADAEAGRGAGGHSLVRGGLDADHQGEGREAAWRRRRRVAQWGSGQHNSLVVLLLVGRRRLTRGRDSRRPHVRQGLQAVGEV